MTRCLDCGSERIADQCPSCGLTSAAAEVMFKRRLLKRTAVFLTGSRFISLRESALSAA
jgi:hypothetical protein